MYYQNDPNRAASVTWSAQTRGGGNEAVGIIVRLKVGSVSGLANVGFSLDINGSSGDAAGFVLNDDGSLEISRYNSAAGHSLSGGTINAAGTVNLWIDLPTTVITGTNPTVYSDHTGSWAALSVTGADNVAGTANNINGAITATLGADAAGHWKIERLYVFVGNDRPDSASEARQVALGSVAPTEYLGHAFVWAAQNSYVDTKQTATGTNSGGALEVFSPGLGMLHSTCTVSRPKQKVADNTGSPLTTYYDFATGVRCMVQDANSSESLVSLRQTGETAFNVFFPYGQSVRNGDRLIVSDAGLTRTFSVTGPPQHDPMRRHYTMVPCIERQGGGVP